jgi:hypothetical protein
MREKLVAMPARNAQPAMKLANAMPTPSITAMPRKIARSRRRPTFWPDASATNGLAGDASFSVQALTTGRRAGREPL